MSKERDALSVFDQAVAAELERVSHVPYDSHEICKHFASKVRERIAALPVGDAEPVARWRVVFNGNSWIEWYGEAPDDKTLLYAAPPQAAVPADLKQALRIFMNSKLGTQAWSMAAWNLHEMARRHEHLIAARPDAPAGEKS